MFSISFNNFLWNIITINVKMSKIIVKKNNFFLNHSIYTKFFFLFI